MAEIPRFGRRDTLAATNAPGQAARDERRELRPQPPMVGAIPALRRRPSKPTVPHRSASIIRNRPRRRSERGDIRPPGSPWGCVPKILGLTMRFAGGPGLHRSRQAARSSSSASPIGWPSFRAQPSQACVTQSAVSERSRSSSRGRTKLPSAAHTEHRLGAVLAMYTLMWGLLARRPAPGPDRVGWEPARLDGGAPHRPSPRGGCGVEADPSRIANRCECPR